MAYSIAPRSNDPAATHPGIAPRDGVQTSASGPSDQPATATPITEITGVPDHVFLNNALARIRKEVAVIW